MIALLLASIALQSRQSPPLTSTGREISPVGKSILTGGFPNNMELSPDGRFAALVHGGTEQNLVILDTQDGHVTASLSFDGMQPGKNDKDSLYFGVRFAKNSEKKVLVFVAHGAADRVDSYELSGEGKLSGPLQNYVSKRPLLEAVMPNFLAGLAVSSDASKLYAVGNQTFALSDFKGSLTVFDIANPTTKKVIPLPAFPLDARLITTGPLKDKKLYVSCERDGLVAVVNTDTLTVEKTISVGDNPTYMAFDSTQKHLFVSCTTSDTVSIIDTETDNVAGTVVVRPVEQRGLPGANPLGLWPSTDGKSLFVALSDLNALAVVDLTKLELKGLIPTGWYPTCVVPGPHGLLVAAGKGTDLIHPNRPDAGASREQMINGDSGPNIRKNLHGSVAYLNWPASTPQLKKWTGDVIRNNRLKRIGQTLPKRPGIDKVIYVIKENRTYDQFFGDFKSGNGDPSLLLYNDDYAPNQRELARRFGLFDNFYACAEMSADGWSWTTAGIASEYVERNAQYDYSGHKREYDYEGQTNGTPSDAYGMRNVNDPPGKYLWDNAVSHGVELMNYGMYLAAGVNAKTKSGKQISIDNEPTMKALVNRSDPDYRFFDLDYAESEVWEKLGKSFPKRRLTYGSHKEKSRIGEWRRDYQRLIAAGKVPPLMLVRFGNDHTQGTTEGAPTPSAMIADNDYAVGQLIETVSHGPLWKQTAIVVIEDDAQGGYDHVDGHRSTCWIISPWVKKGANYHQFLNTDDALRTVEWLLGLPPTNQFTATAHPIDCFATSPSNDVPYVAKLPASSVMVPNTKDAYRAQESARLFSTFREESAPDRELADILWGARFGKNAARPKAKSLGME